MNIEERKELDKFYTKPEVAMNCWKDFRRVLNEKLGFLKDELFVIEPSAGSGNMLNSISSQKIGFDLSPEYEDIIENDFLQGDISEYFPKDKHVVFFGNPPFGKRSKLAISFVNKALEYSDVVGYIVPIQFKKYSVQGKINKNAKLIFERDLPHNAFMIGDKDYKVRCVFQIWTTRDSKALNKRVGKPITTHKDFELYQYNVTDEAMKFFNYDWDICLLRQGYGDFNKIYTKNNIDELSTRKQWIFIKANDKEILERIKRMDFDKLASLNTSTKGYGKHDFIEEYKRLKKSENTA